MLFDTTVSLYREFLRKKRISRRKKVTTESKSDISISKLVEQLNISKETGNHHDGVIQEASDEKPRNNNDEPTHTRNLNQEDSEKATHEPVEAANLPFVMKDISSEPDTPVDAETEKQGQCQPQTVIQQVRTLDPDAPVEDDEEEVPDESFNLKKSPPRRLKRKQAKAKK
mmetsp:Transcript_18422/g.23451  ORF Transcript_18422/g.23451 Transcript_18422/m.23451 type:complete len:170 (-) Transcript_18422:1069-1578(-)